jgi:hypothetical protein
LWEGPSCGLVASYERAVGIHDFHLREEDSTLKTEAVGSPKIVFFFSSISILTFLSLFIFPFSLSISTAEFPFPSLYILPASPTATFVILFLHSLLLRFPLLHFPYPPVTLFSTVLALTRGVILKNAF